MYKFVKLSNYHQIIILKIFKSVNYNKHNISV